MCDDIYQIGAGTDLLLVHDLVELHLVGVSGEDRNRRNHQREKESSFHGYMGSE